MDEFAPFRKRFTVFIVKNISSAPKKVVRIFQYPILPDDTRDLLTIPGVSEASIRASLLKGEIKHKLESEEIIVIDSDVDLLQFNSNQKTFLTNSGITKGLEVGLEQLAPDAQPSSSLFLFKQNIPLIGNIDSINTIFFIPDKALNQNYFGNEFKIIVRHNGRTLLQDIDYLLEESSGPGTGYDKITLISFIPRNGSKLYSDYIIKNV